MSIWDKANKIEELAYRIGNVRDMIEIIAADSQDPHSGALWGIWHMLDTIQDDILQQTADLMADSKEMRQLQDTIAKIKAKKGKKK